MNEDCYLRMMKDHHQHLVEEARLERLLESRRSAGRFVSLREHLGEALIRIGQRLKTSEPAPLPRRASIEAWH